MGGNQQGGREKELYINETGGEGAFFWVEEELSFREKKKKY